PSMWRVGFARLNNNRVNPGRNYPIGAGPSAPSRGARLQRDIERGVFWDIPSKTSETLNFGMRKSGPAMVSARDDSVPNNQNSADRGIRARLPDGLSRFS